MVQVIVTDDYIKVVFVQGHIVTFNKESYISVIKILIHLKIEFEVIDWRSKNENQ